ncbi:MAG TPA: RNA chaperone Hfq [Terriglobales bacterium]|nr:RNA chaperone Hfq [Terriglobales bacterium]
MKDALESAAVGRAADTEGYGNRKLIRPSLNRPDPPAEHRERPERPVGAPKKIPPPEQTHAENFYYQKQMQSKTPMVVVLHDGEEIQGVIEWYDRSCIKVNRSDGQPNLLIYKPAIKYMFKAGENGKSSS